MTSNRVTILKGEASESDDDIEEEIETTDLPAHINSQQQNVSDANIGSGKTAKERPKQSVRKKNKAYVKVISGEAEESSEDDNERILEQEADGDIDDFQDAISDSEKNQDKFNNNKTKLDTKRKRSVRYKSNTDTEEDVPMEDLLRSNFEVTKLHLFEPKYETLLQDKLRDKNIALRHHMKVAIKKLYSNGAKEVQNLTQRMNKAQIGLKDASNSMRYVSQDLVQVQEKLDIIATCKLLPCINVASVEHSDSK